MRSEISSTLVHLMISKVLCGPGHLDILLQSGYSVLKVTDSRDDVIYLAIYGGDIVFYQAHSLLQSGIGR
jgi:hypothetical protein